MTENYNIILDMALIVNEHDTTMLRDLIYYELERRKNSAKDTLPEAEIYTIVTSAWWRALQEALATIEGIDFTNEINPNTIIALATREEIKDAVISLYDDIVPQL